MKRRNGECGKLRRPIKRNKITDGIYGSTVLYLKFFVLWALVLLADFILEFRFEFLWPFWLLLRSVYDSYKYQGLAFSVFFVSIALTSDMICYFFIPVQWLFFAASTYVWVQYVWHTEKGICFPTVVLWLLFAYTEAAIRLKDLRHMPFHLDLCRPFAAHCIGYPVVTLGFGFKSYVTYRFRQRKQKDVRKENSFYLNLLAEALPIEAVQNSSGQQQLPQPLDKSKGEVQSNGGCAQNGVKSHRKSVPGSGTDIVANGSAAHTADTTDSSSLSDPAGLLKHESGGGGDKEKKSRQQKANNAHQAAPTTGYRGRRQQLRDQSQPGDDKPKDEYCLKLELDIKRLRSEISNYRQSEQELRSQVNSLMNTEKLNRSEIISLMQHNDELQTKIQGLSTAKQSEKQSLERKLGDERRSRGAAEQQLAAERKARQRAEDLAQRAHAQAHAATHAATHTKPECTETCRSRRRELEAEVKQLRRELKIREDQAVNTDRELQTLLQYKESHNEAEMLMAALSALRDKTTHLEDSLSAETRIKLDLFSALGEAKRQLEIKDAFIRQLEKEVSELKGKMAQVLAVMPVEFVQAAGGVVSTGGLGSGLVPTSPLDPNASVYTPKTQSGHLTQEA